MGGEPAADVAERLRRTEWELGRVRRSRRVLMDVLVGIERSYQTQIGTLAAENRRLRRLLAKRGRGRPVPQ